MAMVKIPMIKVAVSRRYGVIGIYKTRGVPLLRIYPIPFIRITVNYQRYKND